MSHVNDTTCISAHDIGNKTFQTLPATLVSSSLSIIGSILIIISFILWSEVRQSNARKLIFFLAISDFFTGVGFLAAVIRHYVYLNVHSSSVLHKYPEGYVTFCKGQAAITVYFQCVSFFITASIAIYFFVILVCSLARIAKYLTIVSLVVSWTIPLIISVVIISINRFGIGDSRSSVGWCFIDNEFLINTTSEEEHSYKLVEYFVLELVSEKIWEISTCLIIIGCYLGILLLHRYKYNKKSVEEENPLIVSEDDIGQWNTAHNAIKSYKPIKGKNDLHKAVSKADYKFILIPIFFILFRMWGTVRFFISMMDSCHIYNKQQLLDQIYDFDQEDSDNPFFCINQYCFDILYNDVLLFLHAFGDPGQGFGNAILFVFLSKPIVMKMFVNPVVKIGKLCHQCCARKVSVDHSVNVTKSLQTPIQNCSIIVTYRQRN
jgi:G protein-coupled receptor 157